MRIRLDKPRHATLDRRAWLAAWGRWSFGWMLAGSGVGTLIPSAAAEAPALLLANLDGPHIDPQHYLVSEKLDGVRAYWDGRTLRFRSGRTVAAPAWFVARLPAGQPLDGELWLGRRRFDTLSGTVRTDQPDDAAWQQVRYMLFELPGVPGRFDERLQRLAAIAEATTWPALQVVPHRRVADRAALQALLEATVRDGGEGLMLHRADAPYATGRSDLLIKLKPRWDNEAVVVGHRAGRGKYLGMLGALELETPNGKRFLLGTGFTDAQRRDPPPLGATVSYRYRELTPSGLPRFASFLRVQDKF
jgi:DNA ligase 1